MPSESEQTPPPESHHHLRDNRGGASASAEAIAPVSEAIAASTSGTHERVEADAPAPMTLDPSNR